MFGWLKKKPAPLLPAKDQEYIVDAIKEAEKLTSGEIRVFVESRCSYVNPVDRASELFYKFGMDKTKFRNGVILYVALKDHQLALYADAGIYEKTGGVSYWNAAIKKMKEYFKEGEIAKGMANCVLEVGSSLTQYFPYDKFTDKNELPDEIVFGK